MRASFGHVRAARQAAAGVRMVLVRRMCMRHADGLSPGREHSGKGAVRHQGGCRRPLWAWSMRTASGACWHVEIALQPLFSVQHLRLDCAIRN